MWSRPLDGEEASRPSGDGPPPVASLPPSRAVQTTDACAGGAPTPPTTQGAES